MIDRGFGIELEADYGEVVQKDDYELDWFQDVDDVDFKMNDEAVTKSGGSRMNKRARPGIIKPTGSTKGDADLQRFIWYFRGYLDNYEFTEGSNGGVNTHEFWGGEDKELQSFRGMAVYDMLIKYIRGLLVDKLSFEVSDESMSVSADWVYQTEEADIIGQNGATFTRPADLEDDLFIMFYDVDLYLGKKQNGDPKPLDGIATNFSFEGSNNHDVDGTIGLGARHPQVRAMAGKRENNLAITTSLTEDTVRAILDAQYGEVGALEPSECKLLQVPLQINVSLCEVDDIEMVIIFPRCTVNVEYDMSGADRIEVTMNMATLGSDSVTLADNSTTVTTDMYVMIKNGQGELEADVEVPSSP